MNNKHTPNDKFSLSKNGQLRYFPDFLSMNEATSLYVRLCNDVSWQEESIMLFGQVRKVPRLIAFYGDEAVTYTYSKRLHTATRWSDVLLSLKGRIEAMTKERFNSVLCNYYRDGGDAMGWHADNERELGVDPFIASLSFGVTRKFKVRHNRTKEQYSLMLEGGSLLLMSGKFQQHWQHSMPRSRKIHDGRINLTFRQVSTFR
ncbi:Alkylated DNA repair protein AlkB [hydrothermal vent metagenome]|uniref:Alkylated DNA repair protein AlkB n=1 Tax=hydrothermal vent metagenome TaxID=652676 RepID=A0A3B0ZV67_9ZZZZ